MLKSNQLAELPSKIKGLRNLKDLDLYDNHLSSLPPEFARLTNLTALILSKNPLKKLPLLNLPKLKYLDLSQTKLPQEMQVLARTESECKELLKKIRQYYEK